jgi:hypothetical protein
MKKPATEDMASGRNARLAGLGRAAAECFGGRNMPEFDPEAFKQALQDLKKIVRALPGAYAVIVGGLALQEWGYERYTEDIDVVVDAANFGAVTERLRRLGYDITPERNLRHRETKIEIDLLKEGAQLKGSVSPLPHPRELGRNLGFASLPALIALKLNGNRRRDLADVVELLKRHPREIEKITAVLPAALQAKFIQLAEEARQEMS